MSSRIDGRGPRRIVDGDGRFWMPDPTDEECREHEADSVDHDSERCAEDADEDAGGGRAQALRRRSSDLELRVALDELVALDDRGQIALIRDVEEDAEAAGDEGDDIQLPDRQRVEGERDRDRQECDRTPQIAHDEDGTSTEAVDPDAGRQAEEHEWKELEGVEQTELERRDPQTQSRHDRHREDRDLRPEDADRLAGPEFQEVGVSGAGWEAFRRGSRTRIRPPRSIAADVRPGPDKATRPRESTTPRESPPCP